MTFYFARFLGSTCHTISPYVAGIAFVFLALSPINALDHLVYQVSQSSNKKSDQRSTELEQVRFSSRVSRCGTAYSAPELVHSVSSLKETENEGVVKLSTDQKNALEVSERCDNLYRGFLAVREGGNENVPFYG